MAEKKRLPGERCPARIRFIRIDRLSTGASAAQVQVIPLEAIPPLKERALSCTVMPKPSAFDNFAQWEM
jgi:hypothetical protein